MPPTTKSPDRSPGPTPGPGSDRRPTAALWAARATWLAVAVVGGAGIGEALADRSRAVQLVGTVAAWTGWAAVAAALAIPAALGLTVARMVAPVGVVIAAAALVTAGAGAATVAAVVTTVLAALAIGSGEFGQVMVQASAYGDEQRFVLRPPAAFLVPTVVSWAVWCTASIAGPLLLAAQHWVLGLPVMAFAVVATVFLLPRFHRLTRRWVVLVPAGLVVHDHVVLAETVMFPLGTIARIRLALVDTRAADLTGPAGGHAVEVSVSETTTVVVAGTRAEPRGVALHLVACLVAPSRPGTLLAAAAQRHLPVG